MSFPKTKIEITGVYKTDLVSAAAQDLCSVASTGKPKKEQLIEIIKGHNRDITESALAVEAAEAAAETVEETAAIDVEAVEVEAVEAVEIEESFDTVEFAPEFVTRFTTAEKDYDGFGTETIEETGYHDRNRRPVRKVQIRAEHLDWQEGRNGSGLRQTCTEEQFNEFVEMGAFTLIQPTEPVVEAVAEQAPEVIPDPKKIKITGDYATDLKAAISAGLFLPNARPKTTDLDESIKYHNKEVVMFLSGKPPASEVICQVAPERVETEPEAVEIKVAPYVKMVDKELLIARILVSGEVQYFGVHDGWYSDPAQAYVIGEDAQSNPKEERKHYLDRAVASCGSINLAALPEPSNVIQFAPVTKFKKTVDKTARATSNQVGSAPKAPKAPKEPKAPKSKTKSNEPLYIAPKSPEDVKEPKPDTVAGRFVAGFTKGITEAEIQALIPPTNKAKPMEFCRYMSRYGFGIRQESDKFFLIDPRQVAAVN